MDVSLLRHATLLVRVSGKDLLVDPMLSRAGVMPPIPDSPNDHRNPLVPLPEFDLDSIDAVLITHPPGPGDPITMTAEDVALVCRHATDAKVIAIHMEAINHCLLTRAELQTFLAEQGLTEQVLITADGERMEF